MSNIFKFKHFSIQQEKSAMKIGTDGTLLGAWCDCETSQNVLDVGTGTGLIALMIAQRNDNCNISAIEIEPNAAEEANLNFKNSNWRDRLTLINNDLGDFEADLKFDLIVSNPPFFIDSKKNNESNKTLARHAESLPFDVLIKKSIDLLSENGKLSVVLPVNEANVFIEKCYALSLYLTRRTIVYSNTKSDLPFRYLMAFSFKKEILFENNLIIETEVRHSFTDEYIKLCKDFFLKF